MDDGWAAGRPAEYVLCGREGGEIKKEICVSSAGRVWVL